jgi:hypothetical protein
MIKKEDNFRSVEIDDSPEMKEAVFNKFVEFMLKHDCYNGESYCQCDGPQIDSMNLMSELLDEVIKPKVTWKDE